VNINCGTDNAAINRFLKWMVVYSVANLPNRGISYSSLKREALKHLRSIDKPKNSPRATSPAPPQHSIARPTLAILTSAYSPLRSCCKFLGSMYYGSIFSFLRSALRLSVSKPATLAQALITLSTIVTCFDISLVSQSHLI
jgi:hypothetical protein